ncbi:MAG: hypothetical protein JWR19_3348 [Pedosphaera sp.]|nr:hypothetical protein [Pedosphaera sp.]
MWRRWRGISIVVEVALLLLIGWGPAEPSYDGRSLSSWLTGFDSEVPEARWKAAEAVWYMGTNAVPLLTARLREKESRQESRLKQEVRQLLRKQSVIDVNLPRPVSRRAQALAGLDVLGPVAKEVAPAVEEMLHEKPPDYRALLVLGRFGPEGVPALTRALTNDEKVIRLGARVCLEMRQAHSEILSPRNLEQADFGRRICMFNLKILQASFQEYRAQHPEEISTNGVQLPPPSSLVPEPMD